MTHYYSQKSFQTQWRLAFQCNSNSSNCYLSSRPSDDNPDKKGTSKVVRRTRRDEVDFGVGENSLSSLLDKLDSDPGHMAILSGKQLEVLAEMNTSKVGSRSKFSLEFLNELKEAAHHHLAEKNEIRDALGLLKLYHHANSAKQSSKSTSGWANLLISLLIDLLFLK